MFLAMSDIYRRTNTHTHNVHINVCDEDLAEEYLLSTQDRIYYLTLPLPLLLPLSAYLLTEELSLCHDGYHSMVIFRVIIWFSISSLKRLGETICPHYTQGQSNINQKEGVVWLARSRYHHLVWFQWAWLFVRCDSLHSPSHFLPLL